MPTMIIGIRSGALSPDKKSGAQTSVKAVTDGQRNPRAHRVLDKRSQKVALLGQCLIRPIAMLTMMVSILSGALTSVQTPRVSPLKYSPRKAAGRMGIPHYEVAAMRVVNGEAPSSATRKKRIAWLPYRRESVVQSC